jgi:hypothetical protein
MSGMAVSDNVAGLIEVCRGCCQKKQQETLSALMVLTQMDQAQAAA